MSHSRELNRGSTVTSKKSFRANVNGGPFSSKAPCNHVYGGPPEFGVSSLSPRPEDYSEIFGSFHVSRASSIPVLDLPELDEKEVFFDVRSSSFDYSEVFGGFDSLDFAATYEELTKEPNEGDGDSSDEAWTPAGTESLSDDSDHSSKMPCMLNGDADLSFDRCTEFKVSFNQAYQSGKEDMSNGIPHANQVNEVPSFTYLVDGTDFRGQDDENQSFNANDDGYFNIDLSVGPNESKLAKKKASQTPTAIYERPSFENDPQTPKGSDKSSSGLDENFITISEINLRTEPSQVPPPSRPPPIIGVKKLYSKLNSNSVYVFPEGISGDSSPPFFDVEVDASSSAAASAAAMKEVMDKARAKLLSAKELMERKKEGLHNRSKQHVKYDMKDKEGSGSELLDRSDNGNSEEGPDRCEIVENEMIVSVTDEMRRVKEVQVSLKEKKLFKVADKFAENRFKDDDIDDSREWKEAERLSEVKPDNSRKATDLVKNENTSGRTIKTENDIVIEALEQLGENDKEVDAVLKVHGLQKTRGVEGKNWQEDDSMMSKPVTVLKSQREHERSEGTLYNFDLKEDEKNSEIITHLSVEKKGNGEAHKPVKYGVLVEVKHNDNGGEVEQTITEANGKTKSQDINGSNDNDSKLKEISVVRESELGEMEGIQRLQMEEKLTEFFDMSEYEERLKIIHGQNENERTTEDTLEALSAEKRLEDDIQEGNGAKPPKKPSEKEVGESLKDDEEYEKKLEDIHERWENILTKHKKHSKENYCRKKLEEVNNKEPSEMEIKEAGKQDKIEAPADNASQYKEFVRMFEDHERGELKKNKLADRAPVQTETEPSKLCDEVFEVHNEYQAMQQHDDKSRERVEATQGFLDHNESSDQMGEHQINKIQLDSTGMMHLESAEDGNAFYRGEEVVIDLDWQVRPEDVEKSLAVDDSGNKDIDIGSKMTYCDIETDTDVAPIAENVKASGISDIFEVLENTQIKMKEEKNVLTQDESEKKGKEVDTSIGHQRFVNMNSVPKVVSGPDHQDSKYDQERGEQGKALNLKGNKENFVSTHVVKGRDEKENKCEANDGHNSGGKENTPNLASEVNAGQFIAREDKIMNDTHLVGDRETERMKKKQELENDRLTMEEEREREREREKDRMIIDRTTLEGRKENNEGHAEKAAMERAIAEAQRKAMWEARERLEKACAEAREMSLTGKVALEARVRAERAAAERVNAEARERAFEKAMAEKSVFESRERMERSFSDKLSASSRGTVMRQSSSFNAMPDLQFQRTDTSSGSRYTYFSSNDEVSEGVNGESAQRCKARWERHRRTAERAAKALAEKNMRDILAQRELVERNRLAETLDADVRRWSSGKEGNLRALLSTLQYILSPESGWQPVPLTEVITAAAVKKAYRKATLCVHPDKLQQRGASIQQKYICEKVFDLLKEAWNKFNSEER